MGLTLSTQCSCISTSNSPLVASWSKKSQVTFAMFVGFNTFNLGDTWPPTNTKPICTPCPLYTLCRLSTRFRCAVLASDKEKKAGNGSLCRTPLVTMSEGFAFGEDFAKACNFGMAHWLTRYRPIVVVYAWSDHDSVSKECNR